jgi:hypothetical protein
MLPGGALYIQPFAHGATQFGYRIMQPAALFGGALLQRFGG